MNIKKLTSYLLYGIMALSVLVFVLYFFDTIDEGMFLGWAYALFAIAAISAILFPLLYFIFNPKKAKGAVIGIIALLVVFGLAYLFADNTIPKFVGSESFDITEGLSKRIGTGLWSLYILALTTIGVILYSEISKMFK